MKHQNRTDKKQIKINKSKVTEIKTKTGKIKVWSEKKMINDDETKILVKLTKLKHIYCCIAVLPDFHISGSLMNGSVIPTKDYIYPNAVGGDIGCGMASLMLPVFRNEIMGKEKALYKALYNAIPTGRRTRVETPINYEDKDIFQAKSDILTNKVMKKLKQQLGTVGDGNHFLELQKNNEGQLQLLVHTGSRYFGQLIKEFYSKQLPEMVNNQLTALKSNSELGKKFLMDHNLALLYAVHNREEILREALKILKEIVITDFSIEDLLAKRIDMPHNYISQENFEGEKLFIHRKGAQKVGKGELAVIPGDMGSNTYLVEGRGYPLTFDSCSHGTGRKLSRGKALSTINYEQFLSSVKQVFCRTDRNVLDEAPQAYKDIEQVLKYQKEIVKTIDVFKPIVNIKG